MIKIATMGKVPSLRRLYFSLFSFPSHHAHRRHLLSAYLPLLVLLGLTHLRLYREDYWHFSATNVYRNVSSQREDHVLFYQSFLYPKGSNTFGSTGPVSTTLATLFVADASQNFSDSLIYCYYRQGPRGKISTRLPLLYTHISPRRQVVPIMRMVALEHCRLRTYVALCTFGNEDGIPEGRDAEHRQKSQGDFMLEFRKSEWGDGNRAEVVTFFFNRHFVNNPTTVSLGSWQHADTTPRQLVLCVSRVFAFENWRLLVTALEVYRRLGVDLVVTHVLSAVSPLFALMRHYESAGAGGGLLRVKPALVFPRLRLGQDSDVYDPNSQTEHTNQLTAAHECFYEYKASAAFIALIDWDDLLLTGGGGVGDAPIQSPPSSLPEAFQAAFKHHPTAAYFSVNKLQAALPPFTKGDTYEFATTLRGISVISPVVFNEHKLVVVPSRLFGFWTHNAENLASPNYTHVQLPTTYALMLHLAGKDQYAQSLDFAAAALIRLNWSMDADDEPEEGTREYRTQTEYNHLLDSLSSYHSIYAGRIGRCAGLQRFYYKVENRLECLGYHLCDIRPQPGVRCVSARNSFHSHLTGSDRVIAHVRHASSFMESDQGCAV